MDVSNVVDRMNNKIGPLPAWAWAAIPAGAFVAWSYYQARTDDSVASVDAVDTSTSDAVSDYGVNTGGSYLPSYGAAPNGSSNLPQVETPEYNNATWFRQALNFLIGEGVLSTDAVTALNAYLYGVPQTLNSGQMNALQRAIAKFGAAPDGGAFIPQPTPTPTPTPTPPKPPTVAVPDPPTTVGVSMVPTGTTVSLKATWGVPQQNGGAAIIGYKVELQYNNAGTWKAVSSTTTLATARSFSFDRLAKGKTYLVRVAARNSKGYGGWASKTIVVPK